jgi:hypothetical protein
VFAVMLLNVGALKEGRKEGTDWPMGQGVELNSGSDNVI